MRYPLTPIFARPWLLNGLSLRLIESHYENHYGGLSGASTPSRSSSNHSTLPRLRPMS